MIKFKCTMCSEPLEVPDSLAGDVIDCPKCNDKLKVPDYEPDILIPTNPMAPAIKKESPNEDGRHVSIKFSPMFAFRFGYYSFFGFLVGSLVLSCLLGIIYLVIVILLMRP